MYNILNIMKKQYDKYERKAIFTNLDQFDIFAGENDFIEVCEWRNGEGVDIDINGNTNVSLSYGQFNAIKWCLKRMED